MKWIDLPVPHGFLIWRGKQTAIAMNEPIPTDKLLIVSNGEAYGEAKLSKPIATNVTEFERRIESHCIKSIERKLWWPDANAFFVHNIKEFKAFDEPVLFENGEMVDYKPTEDEQAFINQASELPKELIIDAEAVVICGDGEHIISDKVKDFSDIVRVLEAGIEADGSENAMSTYKLALIRNPRLVVKKKEADSIDVDIEGATIDINPSEFTIQAEAITQENKQDEEGEPMPWVIVEDGFGDCEDIAVVKVDSEEVVGCHTEMEDAEAQLAALNMAEAEELAEEESKRDDDEEKEEDFDKRVIQAVLSGLNKEVVKPKQEIKAGRRLKTAMLKRLKDAMATIKDLLSWAEYSGESKSLEISTEDMERGIAIKEVDGEPWHFMFSTNAFEDREGEIFSTKALENFVLEVSEKEDKGTFDFWHIPGTDFADKKFIEVIGRFLVEAGPYRKDHAGRSALKFFKEFKNGHPQFAPEGWGGSPEFKFLPEDRADNIYDWLWIVKSSTLPRAAAANIYTETSQQEVKMTTLTGERKESAVALFGETFVNDLINDGEKQTETLEEAGVAHKENKPEEIDLETVIRKALAEQVELDLSPLTDVMTQMGETMKAQSAEIEALKTAANIKADAETPRYVLSLTKRASEAQETELADDDDLKTKKPVETPAEKSMAGQYFGR